MSLTPKFKFTLGLVLVLTVLLIILFTGSFLYLPHFLESEVFPRLAQKTGISDLIIDARAVGIFGADFGVVQIGSEKKPL